MATNKKRIEYLNDLAFEYDVPKDIVFMLADVLGENWFSCIQLQQHKPLGNNCVDFVNLRTQPNDLIY